MSSLNRRSRIMVMCLVCVAVVASLLISMVVVSAAGNAAEPTLNASATATVATITVNSNLDTAADDGQCTLREAIMAANTDTASGVAAGECAAGSGTDTITFSVTGTITLASELPDITTPMTISGPGASSLTVSGNNTVRVFSVSVASPKVVAFTGLTVANGKADGSIGGGILNINTGTVNVTNSTLSGNSTPNGGGGGIDNGSTGTVNVTNSTLSNNSAPNGSGGGISNLGTGTVNVTNSTLSGNSVTNGGGGGIFNNSTGTVNVTNSTLSNNSASIGGGIYRNSGTVNLGNTIVAKNTSSFGPDIFDLVTSQGYNLVGDTSGATITATTGDQFGNSAAPLDPLLGPLQDNGGPTFTRAPLFGSPAIDKGNNMAKDSSSNPVLTDQRGFTRPYDDPTIQNATGGDGSDIGAVELQGLVVNSTADTDDGSCDATGTGTGNQDCTLREAINAANAKPGPEVIDFSVTGTITLGSELQITTPMTISGPEASQLTVSGGGTVRVFNVNVASPNVVTFTGLTVANGKADGGGIDNSSTGTVNVTDSTLSGNSAPVFGGGILNSSTGTVNVTNSTLSNNNSAGSGGGIFNNSTGTVNVTNSTLSNNSGKFGGGGIDNNSTGTVNVTNSTLSGNSAAQGGGIYRNAGTVNLGNTIVAKNTASSSGPDVGGLVTSQGYNLVGDTSGATITATTGDQFGNSAAPLDPLLGPLQDNGGPTQTQALLFGSPAIDKGKNMATNPNNNNSPILTDQRGFTRPYDDPTIQNATGGDGSDIGAVELQGLVVNSTADTDDGSCDATGTGTGNQDCTLREAINAANAKPGPEVIDFSVTGTITLGSELPQISSAMTISGPGASSLTVSGNNTVRVFLINVASPKVVAFTGLTVANGKASNAGGGISNLGTGTVNVTNSTLSNNSTPNGGGGGIDNGSTGTVNVTNSTLSNNNSATNGEGGGILNSSTGTANVTNSTLSGNSATNGFGGGIFNNTGTVNVTNSTVSNNSATNGNGGGIDNNYTGTVNVTNSTLSGNSAGSGGGIYRNAGTVNLGNTIVAKNTSSFGPDISGSVTSQGYNLVGDTSGATITATTGDQFGNSAAPLDPLLGPLQDNGGPTFTRAPLFGSPAIDKGKNMATNPNNNNSPILTDQRGFTRPFDDPATANPSPRPGDLSDIGAFEVQPPPNTAPTASATPNPAVTNEDSAVQITLQGTDAEDNNLTFTITQQPTSGTLSAVSTPDCTPVNTCTATVTYTPAANYNGADSFKFKANDGTVDSNEVTEGITVNPVADLSISDVAKAEGNTGTTTFTFTVSLDSPAPAGGVSFNASTADGTATTANNDYVGFANQAHTIPQGSTSTTVDVTVNGDTVQETNETFFVNITSVTNATVADGQGQGTILNDDGAPSTGQIIISEFRLSGPGPAPTPSLADSQKDEFVELYNATDSDFVVADSSPVNVSGSGWALVSSDDLVTPKYIIPAGTRIPARGHFLIANGIDYTLSLYPSGNDGTSATFATADGSYNTDIPSGSGLALFRTTNPALFATPTERLDAVGFTGSAFFEGTPLQPAGGITAPVEYSFVRRQTTGRPLDTNNNQNDFMLVSTTGGTINGVASQLGAPGPENLSSPINRGAQIKSSLLDPAASSSAPPNRVRDSTPGTGATAAGTLEIRRTFMNRTGANVTRLRFRIVDVTASAGAPAGTADVRALTSGQLTNVSITGNNGACPSNLCTVEGTTLEEPPLQSNGGGVNSTLSAGVITLAAPLAPDASVNVRFRLGVAQLGAFRFFVIVEALSAASPSSTQATPATDFDSTKGSAPARRKSLPGAAKGAPAKGAQ